jgi:radical SAM superfamily enzyme YgiQ (UPF0313 family)
LARRPSGALGHTSQSTAHQDLTRPAGPTAVRDSGQPGRVHVIAHHKAGTMPFERGTEHPMKKSIYLADLTHRGLILSSNVFPLSIGLIAAYLLKQRPDDVEIELFKYPEDLSAALEARRPDIVGFANYSWNQNISYNYTKVIKQLWPQTTVVFGGPNYGLASEEIEAFWKTYGLVDFHIVREGERAFAQLFEALVESGMDVQAIKAARRPLANCHYAIGSDIVTGPTLERLELDELPSPYLMGLMDKFFDENLCPMIHTTRGCPFKCAFCTEGAEYYNSVDQRATNLREEIHYIARRVRGPRDMYISDANFGMFKQDYEKAAIIAECQKEYAYPQYIHVSTGKNQKERVVDIAKMLDGALNMAASLQSTDPIVLKNVSRSNISVAKLAEVGLKANKVDTGTYSELILGLPGDSLAAHTQSLRDTVEANFDNIRMYQLIMLPQTALNTPEQRAHYAMRSMHRVMPRSFGRYRLAGHEFVSVESEEILVENSTLPFEDYLTCREMDLTVEILHNGKVYSELQGLCRTYGISWFDFILRFFEKRRTYTEGLRQMYDDFRASHSVRLWKTREELEETVAQNIDELLRDDRGTNEMSMSKATAFFKLFDQINTILFGELAAVLAERGQLDALTSDYLDECRRFSHLRKANLTQFDEEFVETFWFDLKMLEDRHFEILPGEARLAAPRSYSVAHLPAQREQLSAYVKEFGRSHDGLGKMVMRYPHLHRVFRRAHVLPLQ